MDFEGAREGNGEMFFRGWGGMLGFNEGGRGNVRIQRGGEGER